VSAAEITSPARLREPEHPSADLWGIVHLIAHDLAAHGIKSRFGPEADFGRAAIAAAGVLEALAVLPLVRDDDGPVPPAARERCQHLQALEDAIKFRRARAAAPCADCQSAPDGSCEDHGRDAGLITDYERTARQLLDAS
jgi:hypothetical protein